MFDDTSTLSSSDSLDFHFAASGHHDKLTDFVSSKNSVDSTLLKSLSINDDHRPNALPPPTNTDLAERARQREQAAANIAGRLREAPMVDAACAALADLGTVLWPPRKKGPGYIDPQIDPFTRSRIECIKSLLALYTHPSSSTRSQWKKASKNAC
jgi:hypothetical protein